LAECDASQLADESARKAAAARRFVMQLPLSCSV
jgi:hypothetical protein